MPTADPAQYELLHRTLMMDQHVIQTFLRRPDEGAISFGAFSLRIHVPNKMITRDEDRGMLEVHVNFLPQYIVLPWNLQLYTILTD